MPAEEDLELLGSRSLCIGQVSNKKRRGKMKDDEAWGAFDSNP
jgi:hypothetical protein